MEEGITWWYGVLWGRMGWGSWYRLNGGWMLNNIVKEQYFQQDNDSKYISKKAKKWFKDNDIQVLS